MEASRWSGPKARQAGHYPSQNIFFFLINSLLTTETGPSFLDPSSNYQLLRFFFF